MKQILTAIVAFLLGATLVVQGQTRKPDTVVIGEGASAARGDGVAIGKGAKIVSHPTVAPGAATETIAIGAGSEAQGWRCSAVGARARAGVVSATALGRATYAWGPHMIAIGRGAYMEQIRSCPDLNVQNACGIAGDSLWLGGAMCHKYIDHTGDSYVHMVEDGGDGKKRWDVGTFQPKTYTIHGMDAFDARFAQDPKRFKRELHDPNDKSTWMHREDLDVAGGSLHFAAGRGTGKADGGNIELQTAPTGNKSQNRKNPLKTGLRIDTDYKTQNATPMLLWDNNAKQLKRVFVGPPDSGGKGYRALVIEN